MENNKQNNPKAFPNEYNLESGMTLRDYFANSAMQGIINSYSSIDSGKDGNHIWTAEMSYKYADAMLKQRE